METHAYGAEQALQDVAAGRQAAARRVVTPWSYHSLIGLALAALLAGLSDGGNRVLGVLQVLLATGALGALVALYRRLTGLWVNTFAVPGLRRTTAVAIGVGYAVVGAGALGEYVAGVPFSMVAAGVVAGVAYVVYWRWMDRRLRALWSR